jgi:hypothetical protein
VGDVQLNRSQLEALDREALIARAEEAGVTRARILTRPELVDELLLRAVTDERSKARARGLFGRARDLVAKVIERGLHLPDAADRLRAMGGGAPVQRPSAPAALPTVTLAEIYAAQGHRDRAIDTLERVLAHEEDHGAARALLGQLRDAAYVVPSPRLPPEEDADAQESPPGESASPEGARPEADECIAIPLDRASLYVRWEVAAETLDYLQATRPGGSIVLRLVVVEPTWDGPRAHVQDHGLSATLGERFVGDLPSGTVVRVAVGYREGDTFLSIAHSPALEAAPGVSSGLVDDGLLRWTPRGSLRVLPEDPDAASIDRALSRARSDGAPIHMTSNG